MMPLSFVLSESLLNINSPPSYKIVPKIEKNPRKIEKRPIKSFVILTSVVYVLISNDFSHYMHGLQERGSLFVGTT